MEPIITFGKFAARLREFIHASEHIVGRASTLRSAPARVVDGGCAIQLEPPHVGCYEAGFGELASALFTLQFEHNGPYRGFCKAWRVSPESLRHWTQIPAIPTSAFKELELSCLPPDERTTVFYSSGTSEQRPSCHFHCAESLALYEASLLAWFKVNVAPDRGTMPIICLTPPAAAAAHSSLAHMFDTICRQLGSTQSVFVGRVSLDGGWALDLNATLAVLRRAVAGKEPVLILGAAFSFVHLLDYLVENNLRFELPRGSRVLETGGYKGRSRALPKAQLHSLITHRFGIPPAHIVCEYGMSEMSSQAYDCAVRDDGRGARAEGQALASPLDPRPPALGSSVFLPGRVRRLSRRKQAAKRRKAKPV